MFADRVYDLEKDFKSEEEAVELFSTPAFITWAKEEFGRELPALFVCKVAGEQAYAVPDLKKQGIPMDWRFYAEIDEITAADIDAEQNIEKRRLLMMEFGINNYLQDVTVLGTDAFGTLLEATIEGDRQKYVKVRNGTPEPEEKHDYLRERGMLTDDGHKIYYIPVSNDAATAKEAVEESWGLPKGLLPQTWGFES